MNNKKILVFDEESFARICHALLLLDGYPSDCLAKRDIEQAGALDDYGLVITSFPYGSGLISRLMHRQTPVVVLSDCLSGELLECLKGIRNSLCMVKPIDYEQFRGKIRNVMSSDWSDSDVCEIV
ncbi:MAG TPA: hypothetical protein VD811_02170 [Desulfuromonadales bacterium]|jgi:hypothetical protein|nr:hypothetical protein [Desulfuromonadales bacterium]